MSERTTKNDSWDHALSEGFSFTYMYMCVQYANFLLSLQPALLILNRLCPYFTRSENFKPCLLLGIKSDICIRFSEVYLNESLKQIFRLATFHSDLTQTILVSDVQACITIYLVKSSAVHAHTCASGMECEQPGTADSSKTI